MEQDNRRWIRCDERLPSSGMALLDKNMEIVIASNPVWGTVEYPNGQRNVRLFQYWISMNTWHRLLPGDINDPDGGNVIAWMPIDEPEPYSGGK